MRKWWLLYVNMMTFMEYANPFACLQLLYANPPACLQFLYPICTFCSENPGITLKLWRQKFCLHKCNILSDRLLCQIWRQNPNLTIIRWSCCSNHQLFTLGKRNKHLFSFTQNYIIFATSREDISSRHKK